MVYPYSRVNGEKCSSKYTQGNRVSWEADEENRQSSVQELRTVLLRCPTVKPPTPSLGSEHG